MRPAMRFENFQIIDIYVFLFYSAVFESARLASRQVPFKRTRRDAGNDFPVTHDSLRRKCKSCF